MSELAIRFDDVGKMYKLFASRRDNLFDAMGFERFTGRRYTEFWALRGIDFQLGKGERLGIIGRNGAGKSTLLKLVTGNLPATEGHIHVNGSVQALLEAGGGLHPEFTGYENIRASLRFLGLTGSEITTATEEIADFTELGRFLDQPFKSYSLGMQARLSFGIATAIQPELLIVDEVLGAGDAYFFTKSTARMTRLMESGASILLVSHALDQVARFCDRTIWLDRGRVAMEGSTPEVLKAYERFVREFENRRLEAKNEKARLAYDAFDRDTYTDAVLLSFTANPGQGDAGEFDVSRVVLRRDEKLEDRIDIGLAQDGDPFASASLELESRGWSDPLEDAGTFYRKVRARSAAARFSLWFFYPQSAYEIEVEYRATGTAPAMRVSRGSTEEIFELPISDDWTTFTTALPKPSDISFGSSSANGIRSRWPGVPGLQIESVRMVDDQGQESSLFEVHRPLAIEVEAVAEISGRLPMVPAALVFRLDGIVVTRHVGELQTLAVSEGDRVISRLDVGPLLLGDGTYLLSIGLYRELDINNTLSSSAYDYFDRSFEFMVTGNPPLHTEVFRQPGTWTIDLPNASETPARARTGE